MLEDSALPQLPMDFVAGPMHPRLDGAQRNRKALGDVGVRQAVLMKQQETLAMLPPQGREGEVEFLSQVGSASL
jgi:hypothetical protein